MHCRLCYFQSCVILMRIMKAWQRSIVKPEFVESINKERWGTARVPLAWINNPALLCALKHMVFWRQVLLKSAPGLLLLSHRGACLSSSAWWCVNRKCLSISFCKWSGSIHKEVLLVILPSVQTRWTSNHASYRTHSAFSFVLTTSKPHLTFWSFNISPALEFILRGWSVFVPHLPS